MNILITGGTGFIGSRLAIQWRERGDTVRVFGQENTAAEKENSRWLGDRGVDIVLGSVSDKDKIPAVVKGIDLVYHFAAAQHEANISDQVFHNVNVEGTRQLLEASIEAGVKRFVHGSSIGVYGRPDHAVNESSECNPDNIYGKTKLEGERVALSYADQIPVVVIRISETYGPGDRRLLKLFKVIQKKRFIKIGPGKNLHQLIYIDDLTRGMLRAGESQAAVGQIILLVGKKPITTNEMVDTIAETMGVSLPPFRAPLFPFSVAAAVMETVLRPLGIQPPLHRRRMDFFKKSFSFSSNKAQELLDFDPRFSFREGVSETARWYREEGLLEAQDTSGEHILTQGLVIDRERTAQIEPFDSFWEAPSDMEKGFGKFEKFYKRNYFKFIPADRRTRTLVISCGPGYLLQLMKNEGYTDVLGIDSDPEKIQIGKRHGLNCEVANAFPFLQGNHSQFDLVFVEQEINHLTKKEIGEFLSLCHQNLRPGGRLIVHSLNGANPITGSEALAQNFDHFNTLTEYSLKQVLAVNRFTDTRVFPLNLYIFYENPANYIGLALNMGLNLIFRIAFIFYGKKNKLFTKKIAAVARKGADSGGKEGEPS